MFAVVIWKAALGLVGIVLVFGAFGWLMYRARRTHTRRIGGITYFQVLYARFPRVPRRRRGR